MDHECKYSTNLIFMVISAVDAYLHLSWELCISVTFLLAKKISTENKSYLLFVRYVPFDDSMSDFIPKFTK